MRAYRVEGSFGLDNLRLAELPDPAPGAGEVLLRTRAVALNYRDLLMVQGSYDPRQPLPLIPCSDATAEVVAVGPGVTRVQPGDRVCPIFAQLWIAGAPTRERVRSTLGGPLPGTLAELMTVSAEGVVKAPDHLADEQAATLACAGVTAWNALTTHGGISAGDQVLVLGTGGVSLFALQLARILGAEVFVVSRDPGRLARALELGAAAGVCSTEVPEWGKAVAKLTGGRGVDLVVEIGGSGTLPQSLRAVRYGGTVALIGIVAGAASPFSIIPVFMNQVRIQGILVGHRESFEGLCRAVSAHRLEPVVDRVFPFSEAPAAFAHFADGGHFGKVCVHAGES